MRLAVLTWTWYQRGGLHSACAARYQYSVYACTATSFDSAAWQAWYTCVACVPCLGTQCAGTWNGLVSVPADMQSLAAP